MVKLLTGLLEQHWHPLPRLAKRAFSGLGAALVLLAVVIFTQSGQDQSVNTSGWLGSNPNLPLSSATPSSAAPSANVLVQVVGEVVSPGVYSLPFGSRVLDAVFAAGGFTAQADQASSNLARVVNDGEQILIGTRGLGGVQTTGVASQPKLVNLNLADAATLDTLPGIGPTLAQRIIDYRTANGGFRSTSDLGKVAGIGANLLGKLKPLVTL